MGKLYPPNCKNGDMQAEDALSASFSALGIKEMDSDEENSLFASFSKADGGRRAQTSLQDSRNTVSKGSAGVSPSAASAKIKTKPRVSRVKHDSPSAPVPSIAGTKVCNSEDTLRSISSASSGTKFNLAKDIVLKPYQVAGVEWLIRRESKGQSGSLLADDMGLGKTVQSIGLIMERHKPGQQPTLVIAPGSLLSQWEKELNKFAPSLRVLKHHGPGRFKGELRPTKRHWTHVESVMSDYAQFQGYHVVISTPRTLLSEYDTYKRDPNALGSPMIRSKFFRFVLDEAHVIRNKSTKTWAACMAIDVTHRVALGATPVQNTEDDIRSILEFLRVRHDNKPLPAILSTCMLRRLKTDQVDGKSLLDLPERTVELVYCIFDSDEQEFYDALESRITAVSNRYYERGTLFQSYHVIWTLLLRERQACDHPSLVTDTWQRDEEALDGKHTNSFCAFCRVQLGANSQLRNRNRSLTHESENVLPLSSTKIRKILELLRKVIPAEEKTIIFSNFTTFLDKLQPFLDHAVDGTMSLRERDLVLDTLQTNPHVKVILVSFKAGGIALKGLNLTSCNNVILADLWWNPALEEQAFDRAHRIGQKRDVRIYKLVVPGTIEDRMLAIQGNKRRLAASILDGGDVAETQKLTRDEVEMLLQIHPQDSG
ncbi:hypothetical protein PUNSTDRAFT_128177 [Punctularia strigosozonata HHB-11173 SS5]|uniref:P-loop containing nucleoside triphosphate hydrolase protein n=1 Tax=Punctularia strigosozonata (strain HHB-11173) TaxID=741275 RepID=R7S465_PUNST|nr:uncharacterized protein PUNSTDRAFT_128177 [Punctularia strigosozonata HHB-11173 SS5]EIN04587.1 hypothetical protein PUNSTDRAFT_128177 [Punctularia strigosozonata HHB-11173 SS5]